MIKNFFLYLLLLISNVCYAVSDEISNPETSSSPSQMSALMSNDKRVVIWLGVETLHNGFTVLNSDHSWAQLLNAISAEQNWRFIVPQWNADERANITRTTLQNLNIEKVLSVSQNYVHTLSHDSIVLGYASETLEGRWIIRWVFANQNSDKNTVTQHRQIEIADSQSLLQAMVSDVSTLVSQIPEKPIQRISPPQQQLAQNQITQKQMAPNQNMPSQTIPNQISETQLAVVNPNQENFRPHAVVAAEASTFIKIHSLFAFKDLESAWSELNAMDEIEAVDVVQVNAENVTFAIQHQGDLNELLTVLDGQTTFRTRQTDAFVSIEGQASQSTEPNRIDAELDWISTPQ